MADEPDLSQPAPLEAPEFLAPRKRPPALANFAAAALLGFIALVAALGAAPLVTAAWQDDGDARIVWNGPDHPLEGSPNPLQAVEDLGPEHCGWQTVRFLTVPAVEIPGRELLTGDRAIYHSLTYVRSSARVLAHTQGDFEPKPALPADAVRTPYTNGDRQLWFSSSEATLGAYIVEGDNVERWPRFDGGCD